MSDKSWLALSPQLGSFPPVVAGKPLLGVGLDLVYIPDFRQQLELPGSSFREVFSARERRACLRSADEGVSLAARWAAREALVKAWSLALYGSHPAIADSAQFYQQIEVVQDAWNRPALSLSGQVAEAFSASLPGGKIFLSLSHDGNYAGAVVAIQVV